MSSRQGALSAARTSLLVLAFVAGVTGCIGELIPGSAESEGSGAVSGAATGSGGAGSGGGQGVVGGSTGSGGQSSSSGGSNGAGSGGSENGSGGAGMGGDSSGNGGTESSGGRDGGGSGGSDGQGAGGSGGSGGSSAGSGGSGGSAPIPELPTTDDGFTALEPSSDSRVVYVSTSGNNNNNGLSPTAPVATLAKGISLLRNGYPDHLLLKRGDVWQEKLGGWKLSGRSPTERMVVGAYGEGPRPRLEFTGTNLQTTGAGGTPEVLSNLAFTSIEMLGTNHDLTRGAPSGANPTCIYWLRGSSNVLFEDMRFSWCTVIVQSLDGFLIDTMRFHRNLFLDSYDIVGEHAQGIFIFSVARLALEENIFDNCGWHPDVPAAEPTIYNHCVYWQYDGASDGLLRNNIILNGASHGAQMRSSGRVEGNVFARNAIGGFLGPGYLSPPANGPNGTFIGNLITDPENILPREGHSGNILRGWGWQLTDGITNTVVSDNIVTHCLTADDCKSIEQRAGSTYSNNVVWDWDNVSSGHLPENAGPFADPDRTLASYNASLGGEESFDAFVAELRKQAKGNYRPAYTAEAIIDYFREGFEPAN